MSRYVSVENSVHVILERIIKSNNPNVSPEQKNDFVNA